jgi:hypothetical protein
MNLLQVALGVPLDLGAAYQVIPAVAVTLGLITHRELALRYSRLTGATPPSGHAVWDSYLKEINQRLFETDPAAPRISELVVRDDHREARNTIGPRSPESHATSHAVWARIVDEPYRYDWPPLLP